MRPSMTADGPLLDDPVEVQSTCGKKTKKQLALIRGKKLWLIMVSSGILATTPPTIIM